MMNYKKLEAWRKSMELVKEIYLLTKNYPKDELYGLTNQTRRSAVSLPSNIAEGVGRKYKKDTTHFLHIARGSGYELATLIDTGWMIEVIETSVHDRLNEQLEECMRLLNGLIRHYESPELR